MMKFALFLVCALVAVQGFQARSVAPEDRALSDIIDKIKEVIQTIKNVISNITSQIPQLIQNIKDKIKEIVGKIPEIINNIKDKIQQIIQVAGEIGRKCIATQQDNIDALIAAAKTGIQGCVTEAQSNTEALQTQIQALITKAEALRDDVVNRGLQCVKDHPLNPVALVKCLKEQVEPISAEIAELQKEVVNTINVAKETAQKVVVNLAQCVVKVETELAGKEKEIITNIETCVKESIGGAA